jgi:meso-butanediol dehydrogenase/(S,S)-butanediol dehydrogenase/diacetyl reductase
MSESSISKGAAIVTGAAQGLGRTMAIRLAKDGYQVAVNDLPSRLEALEQLVTELCDHSRAIAVTGDVTDETSVQGIITKTVTELGDLQLVSIHHI